MKKKLMKIILTTCTIVFAAFVRTYAETVNVTTHNRFLLYTYTETLRDQLEMRFNVQYVNPASQIRTWSVLESPPITRPVFPWWSTLGHRHDWGGDTLIGVPVTITNLSQFGRGVRMRADTQCSAHSHLTNGAFDLGWLSAGETVAVVHTFTFLSDRTVQTQEVRWKGLSQVVSSCTHFDNRTLCRLSLTTTAQGEVVPPIGSAADIRVTIGSPVDWLAGVSGTWGHSQANTIPPMGEITDITLVGGTDPSLSTSGATYDRVGMRLHEYRLLDDHSLSPSFPFDDSFTIVSRYITVHTPSLPMLHIQYASTAVAHLVGNIYDPHLSLPCGGEAGWTSQPLDISIDPDTIVGTFDTLLTLPDFTTTATNAIATRTNYHIESPNILGTPISGFLTAVGDASNLLSGTVNSFVKIDKTNPIPGATHVSGYNFTDDSTDVLSGLSITRPSEIAFSAPSGPQPVPGDFSTFDAIPTMPDGTYDVWVRATDKAGNTATERVLADILLLNGTVEITKDTDQGATLHTAGCPDLDSIAITSCTPECSLGANVEIEEKSALTYKLTLTNTDLTDTASGTFEDYLPEGTIISTMPVVTPVGSATVTFDLETTGPYTGRYKVSGTYTNLAPGGQIEIDILTRAPAFDKVTTMNNIITNEASTNWTIGTDPSERTGSTDSNSAVHELLEIPSVDTLFTKVGANDLNVGLAGTEFALYRWDGALDPTTAELNHIIDYSVLVDNTLPGGDWIRVTYDGEDALALTDIFVSSASPLGEVDLGSLPEGVYTLIETKTVNGYALPMGQWILTIDPGKGDTGASNWKIDFVGKSNSIAPPAAIRDESIPGAPTYKIVNAEPFLIGLSGLEGTTGMLLTGFIIMAIAANTYLVRRHKQKENPCDR